MSENEVKIYYNTWGSYGQHSLAIAILRNGTIVNPLHIERPPRHTVVRKKIGDVEVEVENSSSAKNAHITVYIPADAVQAVVSNTWTSSGSRGWEITYGEGDVETVEEREEKVIEKNDRRFKEVTTYWCYYFVNGEKKVLFYRERTASSLVALDKPRVRVLKNAVKITVEGDTYEIRDALKKAGFKWNSMKWEMPAAGKAIEKVIEELKAVAEVEVVEQKDSLAEAVMYLEKCYEKLSGYLLETNSTEVRRIIDELYAIKMSLEAMRGGR